MPEAVVAVLAFDPVVDLPNQRSFRWLGQSRFIFFYTALRLTNPSRVSRRGMTPSCFYAVPSATGVSRESRFKRALLVVHDC